MSLAPLRGRLREGTSGVDRSQAACSVGALRPRKGDWSDLWLDVIVRRLATSDRRMVTAAECVYSTWQFQPGGEEMEKRYVGVDLHRNQFTVCVRLENGRTYLREWRLGALPQFVKKLRTSDEVAVEATGNTRLFHDSVQPHVARVVVVATKSVSRDHAVGEEDRCQ
jgi:hypothetical protein